MVQPNLLLLICYPVFWFLPAVIVVIYNYVCKISTSLCNEFSPLNHFTAPFLLVLLLFWAFGFWYLRLGLLQAFKILLNVYLLFAGTILGGLCRNYSLRYIFILQQLFPFLKKLVDLQSGCPNSSIFIRIGRINIQEKFMNSV